jgi:hypothetical protein
MNAWGLPEGHHMKANMVTFMLGEVLRPVPTKNAVLIERVEFRQPSL